MPLFRPINNAGVPSDHLFSAHVDQAAKIAELCPGGFRLRILPDEDLDSLSDAEIADGVDVGTRIVRTNDDGFHAVMQAVRDGRLVTDGKVWHETIFRSAQ